MTPFALALLLAAVADEPLAPERAAAIEREQQKAQAGVTAKYGNKKPSELSQDERRQMIRDQADADRKVLEKNGVDAKTWARAQLKQDRARYAEGQQAQKALAAKEQAEAEQAKQAADPGEVVVQRGFSEEVPVTLEENATGEVSVEQGLPPEVAEEQALATEQDRLEGAGEARPAAPPRGRGGGKAR